MKKHPEPLFINDWESLVIGDTLRVPCDHWRCLGKKDAFTITRVLNGCVYNCYRCGQSGAIFKGSSPDVARERIRTLRGERRSCYGEDTSCHPVALPADHKPLVTYDKEIPPHAHAWLYAYELNDTDMDTYYVSYSPKLQRVILPIYNNNKLIAWQGRDIYYNINKNLFEKGILKNKPLKYYTEYNPKLNSNLNLYYNIYNNKNKNIIIVEDIISAIKVYNKYKFNVTALLNSTLHLKLINHLNLYNYNNIYIWLDPDAHTKALQGALKWIGMGLNVTTVRTDTDPKAVPYKDMPQLREV